MAVYGNIFVTIDEDSFSARCMRWDEAEWGWGEEGGGSATHVEVRKKEEEGCHSLLVCSLSHHFGRGWPGLRQ